MHERGLHEILGAPRDLVLEEARDRVGVAVEQPLAGRLIAATPRLQQLGVWIDRLRPG